MDVIEVFAAVAELHDDLAVAAVLRRLPNAEEIREGFPRIFVERKPDRGHLYSDELHTAVHLVSDSQFLLCFVVTNVTPEQAASIAIECDAIEVWDKSAFNAAVERAIGSAPRSLNS